MVSKAWDTYVMEPQSPWESLDELKKLMGTIPSNRKYPFEFIKTWLRIACTKATGMEDSLVSAKWNNLHVERKVLGWMLHHNLFVNSMPIASGTQARESLEPQNCFN